MASPPRSPALKRWRQPAVLASLVSLVVFNRRRLSMYAALLPPLGWMGVFYFAPLALLLVYSFWRVDYLTIVQDFNLQNYTFIFGNVAFRATLLRTLRMALLVTTTDLVLALPVAYYLVFRAGQRKNLLLMLVILPLWSSYLIRIFAWRTILGRSGVLNALLVGLGILDEPSRLFLFNQFAIYVALTHIWLPFMILPITTAFERLPKSLLEAAADLGARGAQTFFRVTLPLVLPGIIAGSITVFSLTMGDYIATIMVGGTTGLMVGKVVADQFGVAFNWPLGGALAMVILVIVFLIMTLVRRTGALENL